MRVKLKMALFFIFYFFYYEETNKKFDLGISIVYEREREGFVWELENNRGRSLQSSACLLSNLLLKRGVTL